MEPFTIKKIHLTESHFKLNANFKKDKSPVEIKVGVHIAYETKDKYVMVTVSINTDGSEQPFVFSVAMQGVFEFTELPPSNEVKRIVHINLAAIIFPFVRETVADLTGRAGIPPFFMEPINFVALFEQTLQAERKKTTRRRRCTTE